MKRVMVFCLLGLGLAGCGADGEPVQPRVATSIAVTNSGVSANTAVSVRQGPFTLGLSL